MLDPIIITEDILAILQDILTLVKSPAFTALKGEALQEAQRIESYVVSLLAKAKTQK